MIRTIGHSTHERDEFIARCRHGGVRTVVDIRSHPTSRWPWFRREEMDPTLNPDSWLTRAGIGYRWVPQLGGWTAQHMNQTIKVQPSTGMPLPYGTEPSGTYIVQERKLVDWAIGHGVDIAAYSRGYFPKGRIAADLESATAGPSWSNQGLFDYAWFTALPEFQNAAEMLIRESQSGYSLYRPGLMCSEFLWWKCHRSMVADYLHWQGAHVTHLQPRMTDHARVIGNRLDRYPDAVRATWGPDRRPRPGRA